MNRLLKFTLRLAGFVALIIMVTVPDLLADPGVIIGSTFITTSITWGGKENLDYFLKPMFIGQSPWETQGVRVIPNVQSSQKLNYFGTVQKILKAYAKGFSAATGTTYTQRTLTVHRMKAEAADDALDFYQTVFESGLRKDDWNNLDGTFLKQIIIQLYQNAVRSDVFRQVWLNDANKELTTSGFINGTADEDYNVFDGLWRLLMDNSSETPTAGTHFFRHTVSDAAVAEVNTVTLTGASGTANVTIGGIDYLATFRTDLNTTHADFVALHAPALALREILLTGTTTCIFTSEVPGQGMPDPTVVNASGDLAGANVDTTANTAPTALAAGESEDIFLALHVGANKVLKGVDPNKKVILCADLVLENYIEYLEGLGTERSHQLLEDGKQFWTYRGIRIINPGWDIHLAADWPQVADELHAYPHRVIYTTIDNLVLGIDSMNQFNETKMWYNPDEEENRFRSKLVMGTDYVHPDYTAVAF